MGMRDFIARMDGLDQATILSGLDPAVRERLSSERFMPRLVMRRARRIASNGLFVSTKGDREQALLNGENDLIENLCHKVGAHILWQEVVRLVRRLDLDAFNDRLGVSARDIALSGRDQGFRVIPISLDDAADDLAECAKREGAVSWACWLATSDSIAARQLRVLTPDSISSLVRGGLPDDPEQRTLRRQVVEFELDKMMAQDAAEASEEVVQ